MRNKLISSSRDRETMSKPISECCPNCSQPFAVSWSQAKTACRIPLFLSCGHNVCESCVGNMVKFTEPIDCRVCNSSMEIDQNIIQNNGLHHVFPINYYLYGKLAFQEKEPESDQVEDPFINLKALLNSLGNNKGQCHECKVQTTKMCKECKTILCESCFKKSHSFGFIKHHVLSDIEQLSDSNSCPIHKKDLEYYCQECKKVICIDCFFFGGENSCKNHNVVPIHEASKGVVEEINEVGPKVDETYRRLTKTAVDIGHLLKGSISVTSQNEYGKIKAQVQQNFSKLYAVVQNHEQDILKNLDKIEFSAKESLIEAKKQVAEGIKKTYTVISKINLVTKNQDAKINLFALLEDAKTAANYPWYLSKDELDSNEHIQLKVNEDLLPKLSSYVDLEGNSNCTYKLRATNELGENFDLPAAPQNPVFPPALIKDIREMYKPRKYVGESHQEPGQATSDRHYKNRYGSNSSLNSLGSSGSNKKSIQGDQFRKPIIQAVSPCLASNDIIPKKLYSGSKEMVYISHIVNPHNFYVQRVSQQAIIKKMMREFRNATSAPKPSQAHATESRVYLVLNTTWKEWQRCKIMHIDRKDTNNPLYHVFCFDFGNTEIVTIDRLRLIAPNWMMNPPPLAIHCSLANCKPVCNEWSTEDALLMQEIIDNNQAVMYVRHVRDDGVALLMTVQCDIVTYQDGVHIACALQFHGRAIIIDRKLPFPPIECLQEKPKIFINNSDFKKGSAEEVNITHVESPDKFYVRKAHLEDTYKNLSSQLNETYIITLKEGRVFNPVIGMSCVAQCPEEGGWVRAVVGGVPGSRRVSISAVDSGRVYVINWTALRHIQPQFTELKALATECHLSGITPPNKRWGTGSVKLLNSLKGRRIQAHVEEEARGRTSCVGVTLYDITDEEPLCINTEMVKLNLAITIGLFRFNKNQVVEEEQYLSRTPLDKPTKPVKSPNKSAVTILKKKKPDDTDTTTSKKNNNLDAKDKGPYKVEVKFLSVQSPSLIYIAVLDKQSSYKEYFEKIQELYHQPHVPVKENLAIGDKCCAFYNNTNTWRRAVILEVLEDSVKLFYSDFGCVDVVPKTLIKEFLPELATVSDAAIKCHMSGIMPAIGEEWPSLTKEFLVELVDAYSRHYITRKGAIKDNSLPIEIWVYHIIQGDALEPNRAEWRCLNNKIIEQGLAIPDKTTMPVSKNKQELDSETISFLNLSGNVKDLLELEPLSNEALECATARYELELKSEEPSCRRESTPPPEDNQESATNYVCDWLPPKPFNSAQFEAIPTYVDNDGNLYLYEVSEQSTLDLIRKALDIGFVGSKGHHDKWVVGQLCIARFYLDGLYYRGRIVEVNKSEKYCIVNYVDYGNDEKCIFGDIINSIVLHQIPIQSHKCVLGRVKPKNNKWSRTTLDYIHKLVVDNKCDIDVLGEPKDDGSVPIELNCNNLLLSDLLVDLDFARYTDGTQAIVTKYVKPANIKQQQVAHKPVDLKPDCDSDAEYYVEEEPPTLHDSSFNTSETYMHMQNKDWNQLLEEEENHNVKLKVFPEHNLKEFICYVAYVEETNVELSIEFENMQKEKYDKLTEEMKHGDDQPPLDGVFANKACLALFSTDNLWYRAEILSYSEATSRVKVRYVDYGNKEVVDLKDVREIPEEWLQLPSRTMSATLHGVKVNEDCDFEQVAEEYVKTFTDPEVIFATIECLGENTRFVILKDLEGKLIYENLIQKGILLENTTNEN